MGSGLPTTQAASSPKLKPKSERPVDSEQRKKETKRLTVKYKTEKQTKTKNSKMTNKQRDK